MHQAVTVFAPASMGNVALGFDILGAALTPVADDERLGDSVRISPRGAGEADTLHCGGEFGHLLPAEAEKNIVWDCLQAFNLRLVNRGIEPLAVELYLDKGLPVGTGLGSSACSVVAALAALNEFYQRPLGRDELLKLMGELEGQISGSVHYDNVAPSYLGGLQLMPDSPDCLTTELPWPEEWFFVMAFPGVAISTSAARDMLPAQYPRSTLIQHGRQLATFVHALHTGQKRLAADMMRDLVAEPYRKALIPGFDVMQRTLFELGALACSISGAGSTCFALVDSLEQATHMQQWLEQEFIAQADSGVKGLVQICRLDTQGARIISDVA